MTEWYADEDFWKMFFPYLFPDERFELAEEQIAQIIRLVDFSGDSILDMACGPGRHSVLLAKKGYRVTGVDRSAFLLSEAEERARAVGVEVEWVHEDMRNFCRPEAFDLCLSMFTSFGYFENKDDDLLVLRNIYDSLTHGGTFLIDVSGKEWLAKNFRPTSSHVLDESTLMIERREIIDDWTRIRNEWILLQDGQARAYHFQHTIYSAQELRDRLGAAGFDTIQIYGDLEGNAYDTEAKRLIAVASKQPAA